MRHPSSDSDAVYGTFNYIRLLHDAHSNRSPKSLRECFRLAHFQGEDLGTGYRGEGRVVAQSLREAHGYCCFSRARLPREEDSSPGDLAFRDHLVDHARGFSSGVLADHALAHLSRF